MNKTLVNKLKLCNEQFNIDIKIKMQLHKNILLYQTNLFKNK